MTPNRIEIENFLTFAGPTVFDFAGPEPLWVIGGPNGVGKSAVFDAVTFALFGEHRGGRQRLGELVRHGADSFRVAFEFGLGDAEFRVTRGYAAGKQTVPKLERRTPGGPWVADKRVTRVPDLTPAVEGLLGLTYDTFTKSVLLKQGEADKLFRATREERAAVLKGIIGFEQYEELSRRVHDGAAGAKGAYEQVRREFESLRPVSDDELSAAARAADAAAAEQQSARAARDVAVDRVGRARAWGKLDARRRALETEVAAADDRARHSAEIAAGKRRLDELEKVVPDCGTLVQVRIDLAAAEADHARLALDLAGAERARDDLAAGAADQRRRATEHKAAADAADARRRELDPAVRERKRWLTTAGELLTLAGKLSRYPKDLPDQLTWATGAEADAGTEADRAKGAAAQARARHDVAAETEQVFAAVEAGAACPHCRQPVTEEHAAGLRRQLREAAAALRAARDECDVQKAAALTVHAAARRAREALSGLAAEHDRARREFDTKKEHLDRDGGSADVPVLEAEVAGLDSESRSCAVTTTEARRLQQDTEREAACLGDDSAAAGRECARFTADSTAAAGRVAKLTGRREAVAGRVPAAFQAELAALRASGVAARFEQLAADSARRADRERDLAAVREEGAAFPDDDRLPEMVAEAARAEAVGACAAAESAAHAAAAALADLRARDAAYADTASRLSAADRRSRLSRRLDELLGQQGLQRELVRSAEYEVVRLADETLRQLSNQELSLEPDVDATGRADKAFAVRVRRAGDPNPIDIAFISGSQRFRVAVALALALGRFAAGKQRPIEAVIIDEGFGSLDEDGLRAMAENLHELRRTQALKRIVLVSHQKNFTDQFAHGYRLDPGPTGSIAHRLT